MDKPTVTLRNVVLGQGRQKILASIIGKTSDEIRDQARTIVACPVDIVEWRIDWYDGAFDADQCVKQAREICEGIGSKALLATFRTQAEGGEKALDQQAYKALNVSLIEDGCVDAIDLELSQGNALFGELVVKAHEKGVKVFGSSHDFDGTPAKEEIIARLCAMQDLGADVLKIAVMPQCRADVVKLIDATREMYEDHARQPLITMAMGSQGMVTRLVGESYGSAATFGAAAAVSAPGQISVDDLKTVLDIVHAGLS